jgi:predicted 3-demethylubiquinone-9 3-methyltransferase (glyoxalase superfamily)
MAVDRITQKITPFLWFDTQAEDAANFYVSVFENSRVETVVRYSKTGPGPEGSVMTVKFQLDGQTFTALNGGPHFRFSEAISFVVSCADQREIDYFWTKLSEGGSESQCGWLKDRFGLSWQIVPATLPELFKSDDPQVAGRVMKALLQMKKLDIAALEAARSGS